MNSDSQLSILIVDNDDENLALVRHILEAGKPDYRVATAPDGFMAIERLTRQWFDLVVTDWNMADMNGLELAEIIRNMVPDARVLLMTERTIAGLDAASNSLLAGWIEKPFTSLQMLDGIEKAMVH